MRLNRTAAAQFLGDHGFTIAPSTLAKKAVDGSGPPYQLWNGQATYDDQDLLMWATSRLGRKLRSTAERKAAPSSQALTNDDSPQEMSSFPTRHRPSGPQSNEESKEERDRRTGTESETRRRPR
jgi:hypothetical protein